MSLFPLLRATFISSLTVSKTALRLMGSTIPLVPIMDMPPLMPMFGLKVFSAIFSPSGTETVIFIPPLYPKLWQTDFMASEIIFLGTEFMAAEPTGWSRPLFVTTPTPFPPSITMPLSIFSAEHKIITPFVASMSSPPSFITPHTAFPFSIFEKAIGTLTFTPLGVKTSSKFGHLPENKNTAAAFEAMAEQVPVVYPHLSFPFIPSI